MLKCRNGIGRARDDTHGRRVDRGDGKSIRQRKLRGGQGNRQHRTLGQALHQLSTHRNQLQSVRQRQYACKRGRNIFANAMANHGLRLDAPGEPLLGQGIRDDEDGRLGQRGLVNALRGVRELFFSRVEQFTEIKPDARQQQFGTLVNVLTKDRLGHIQLAPHVHRLGALTREHKHHRALRRFRTTREDAPVGSSVVQAVAGLSQPRCDEYAAIGVPLPPGCQGVGHIRQVTIGMVGEVVSELVGDILQGCLATGREQQQLPGSRWARGRTWRGLFQHDMGIGATGSE